MDIKPKQVIYDIQTIFAAVTQIVAQKKEVFDNSPMKSPEGQPELALASAYKALDKVHAWQNRGITDLVTKFTIPTNPNLADRPSIDLISQINAPKGAEARLKPKGVILE